MQKGFSLIELMIVVAIIGILSMVAIPNYQSYTHKARFAEVVTATAPFKTAVALALQEGVPLGDLNNGAHGIPNMPSATKNVASIKVENGVITSVATNLAKNHTYVLKPNEDGSNWTVDGTCVAAGLCEA